MEVCYSWVELCRIGVVIRLLLFVWCCCDCGCYSGGNVLVDEEFLDVSFGGWVGVVDVVLRVSLWFKGV